MVSTVASVLAVPLRELYALLWRAGLVEVLDPAQTPAQTPRRVPTTPRAGHPHRVDPAVRTAARSRPRPRSPQPRRPGPEPTRAGRSAYSRAVG
ncbi:Rv1535 domain-containing protein [Mycobacterium alsense]|uniref:Rv1535 domain-containing protein n=1 Tax=Mycobacterium alsense TaxID=324058 RepID=UPI001F0B38C0|nr:Rv1535 domain-containing protein [Mycobacterium alsense]